MNLSAAHLAAGTASPAFSAFDSAQNFACKSIMQTAQSNLSPSKKLASGVGVALRVSLGWSQPVARPTDDEDREPTQKAPVAKTPSLEARSGLTAPACAMR